MSVWKPPSVQFRDAGLRLLVLSLSKYLRELEQRITELETP